MGRSPSCPQSVEHLYSLTAVGKTGVEVRRALPSPTPDRQDRGKYSEEGSSSYDRLFERLLEALVLPASLVQCAALRRLFALPTSVSVRW
jgi:hypothetical protein